MNVWPLTQWHCEAVVNALSAPENKPASRMGINFSPLGAEVARPPGALLIAALKGGTRPSVAWRKSADNRMLFASPAMASIGEKRITPSRK